MLKRHIRRMAMFLCFSAFLLWAPTAEADSTALSGSWYGVGEAQTVNAGGRIGIDVFEYAPDQYAGYLDIPVLGFRDELVPVTVLGEVVIIGDPSVLALIGVRDGDTIRGADYLPIPVPPYVDLVAWQLWKDVGQGAAPGSLPSEPCASLPDLFCRGTAAYAGALVPFEPVAGPGYLNLPENGETWDDQYRSYLRRDLRQLVQYATARVACMTAHWDTWPFAPVGMVDMSEADGSIPGTSIGYPGHPEGSHGDGRDIDIAYYQLFSPDNHPRVIGEHYDSYGIDQYHLLAPPPALDVWRTALLIAYLAEHPRLRVIGVDGQVGLLLEDAFDDLVALGWLDADVRAGIPLVYEVVDMGWGFFRFHHHHLHVSFVPLADILDSFDLKPEVLNCKSKGEVVTAYIELKPGHDVSTIVAGDVALMLDGHTLLYALPGRARVGDHDKDGIPDLMVKFDRRALAAGLANGTAEITLTGVAGGLHFQGTDSLRVIGAD